ncbi:MAG TPA: flagellar biosynthesis protein FliQ [Firmicutes bacterium]|nr:flagellar biosynthesis protein FliQ [Bacillota bacterium]
MTEGWVLAIGREALVTILLVSAPVFVLSLGVGLLVSLLQATTQLHEQTLAFVPKIVAVFLGFLLFGGWMLRILVDFCGRTMGRMGGLP